MESQQLTRLVVAPGETGAHDAIAQLASAIRGDSAVLLVDKHDEVQSTDERGEAEAIFTDSADTAVVIATSGSTGTPRQVELSRQALTAAATSSQAALMGPGLWLTAVPITSIAGTMTVLRSFSAGVQPEVWPGIAGADRFPGASFHESVKTARRRADQRGVPCYTSLVPTQAMRLAQQGSAGVLADLDAVLIGGAHLSTSLLEQLSAAGVTVVSTYGATETCGGVVYDGKPIPGVAISFANDPLAEGADDSVETRDATESGRIAIAGPMLASGYRGDPITTATAFVDGRYLTDDLGYIKGGRLKVSGRRDDIIKTGGRKVSLLRIAEKLGRHPDVLEVIAVPRPDPEWGTVPVVIAVPTSDCSLSEEQLAAELSDLLGLEFRLPKAHRQVKVMTDPPLLAGGKVDRAALLRDGQD